ncbi:MAG: YggS family pyridoxal phosphate-dependent enzyme [Desulfosarcinaceae bacterium]
MSDALGNRYKAILERMAGAAARAGRDPASVRLVAVSKTKPAEQVRHAAAAGAEIFGENYIQEARDKFNALTDLPLQWHFIGHLQSNKAKFAIRLFDLVHTVDSVHLALALNKHAAGVGKVQEILIQVNISGEATKSGTTEKNVQGLIESTLEMPNLKVRGLMTLPPFFDAPEKARPFFAGLRMLRDRLQAAFGDKVNLKELSMGMTGDFEVAIEEGATLVRIGTALFGERP